MRTESFDDHMAEQRRLIALKEENEKLPADYFVQLVADLRNWPATPNGEDGMSSIYVGGLLVRAADALEALGRINDEHVWDAQDAAI